MIKTDTHQCGLCIFTAKKRTKTLHQHVRNGASWLQKQKVKEGKINSEKVSKSDHNTLENTHFNQVDLKGPFSRHQEILTYFQKTAGWILG